MQKNTNDFEKSIKNLNLKWRFYQKGCNSIS